LFLVNRADSKDVREVGFGMDFFAFGGSCLHPADPPVNTFIKVDFPAPFSYRHKISPF
jgi:hypothetical protein